MLCTSKAEAAVQKRVLVVPVYVNSPNEITESTSFLTHRFFSRTSKQSFANKLSVASRGYFNITGSVAEPIQVNTAPQCSGAILASIGRSKLDASLLASYNHVFFYLPSEKGACSWAGMALRSGDTVFSNSASIVTVHEFGHLMGLSHASSFRCTRTKLMFITSDCPIVMYGDSFDVMGIAYDSLGMLFSSYAMSGMGILLGSNSKTATKQDGTYTISNLYGRKLRSSSTYQVVVNTADPLSNWYLDFKTHPGFGNAVTMRKANPTLLKSQTFLLNPQSTSSCWREPPLIRRGDLVMDATNNILIFVKSLNSSSAKVRVAKFGDNASMLRAAKSIRSNCRFRPNS